MRVRAPSIVALAAVVAGVAALPAQGAPARLRSFDSCPELVRYAQAHVERIQGPVVDRPMPMPATTAPTPDAGVKETAPAAPAADDTSATNVQEAGVDEPDVVKVLGGRYLLAVAGGRLHVVDARAATPSIVGSVQLPDGSGHELLVRGDRALVIASGPWRPVAPGRPVEPGVAADILPAGPPTTVLADVDLGDPAAPRVLRTLSFDGSPVSARLTGSTARVVTSSPPHWYVEPAERERASGWVPTATLVGRRGRTRSVRRLVPCDDVRRPATFAGPGMLSVLTVDLDRGLPAVDTDAVMTDAQTVYASPSSLYVATQRWNADGRSDTAIHRFDAATPGETTYRQTGAVRGHLLNQFSLSEHDGVLRAATTDEGADGESESFVTTLRAQDGPLEQLGQVGGLGRGERIYAVRFIGDVGYVVTFRQTDPLYTVDLADPARPRVAGELKIPGYSAYLHPVGDGLLLGVGQDADENGRLRGSQLSLFDVSDPAAPRRLHQRALGTGTSDAEWDHHAFLWWPATKLAVLPVYQPSFQGAIGFRVDARAGIDEVGRVTHDGGFAPRRSVVVGDRLLTMSDAGVEVSALDTLAERAWLPFGG
ncbi:MAG TPA: beta-propeller domain-containing protein [Capillimicrobium sp.]|nr:beta-propeller domain-containing protein [Capillimicrobium sp.]